MGMNWVAYFCFLIISVVCGSVVCSNQLPSLPGLFFLLMTIVFNVAALYQIPYIEFLLRQRGINFDWLMRPIHD